MELHIGDWKSKFYIEVIPLDEYDLVLGFEFFGRADAMINIRTNSIVTKMPIGDANDPWVDGDQECLNDTTLG